jgi:hypothetical protein
VKNNIVAAALCLKEVTAGYIDITYDIGMYRKPINSLNTGTNYGL